MNTKNQLIVPNVLYMQQHTGLMNSILINYTLKFELSFAPQYKWTSCGKCFNVKTGRQIKQFIIMVALAIPFKENLNH